MLFFFFKQKTAYEMRISDWSSDVCSSDLRQIAALYAVETTVRGSAPEARLAARKEYSAPIIAALKPWLEKQLSMISSGSTLAADIRYALGHWDGLTRFLEDGRLALDTHPFENAIRPVALPKTNALLDGHDDGVRHGARRDGTRSL